MTSCNALVYEAIQRVYRNAVVDRIRSGMQAAYPDDYEKRVTSRFSSWDDIVSAAAKSAVTGVVAHPHQDVFDYLDVSHLPVLLDKYFSVLAPVEGLPPEQANELKRQVLSYAREIKTIRDPLSHPGTADIGVFDALRAVDNASRALRVLGLPEAAERIEPLLRQVAAKASASDTASWAQDALGAEVASGQVVRVGSDDVRPGQFIQAYIESHLPTASAVGPLVVGDVPHAAPEFLPRTDLADRLARSRPGAPVARVITGMPGVGKTQIAAEYARSCIDARWRLVAWINSLDLAQVLNGLAQIAGALRVSVPGADLTTIGREVKRRLETDGERSLVVFDDATNPDDLSHFIPVAGRCQVIVTSNHLNMAALGEHIPVKGFAEDEALSFLAKRTGLADELGARQLATELGFLPVALAQAAAMTKARHLDYPTYLARLREQPSGDLLKRTAGEPYRKGVSDAITLALDTVADYDPTGLCRGLVNVVALLSEAGVARDLLYAAGQQGVLQSSGAETNARPQEVDEALGLLAEASLLNFGTDGTQGDTTVAAHRLTMRVAVELQAEQGNLVRLGADMASLLVAVTESLPEPWQNRGAARDAIQQIMALNGHVAPHLGAQDAELARTLLRLRTWTVGYLNELGDNFAQAVEYGQDLVTDSEQMLGRTHHDTLTARNHLATAYRAAGHVDEAILLCERTLADAEQVLGPTHPDTLIARNNLARVYRAAGQLDEAIRLYECNLVDSERVLGPTDPETMKSRNHLADAYRTAGRLDEAIPLFERNLALREQVLGATHRSTLTSRNDLARAYEAAGRLEEAIPLYERNLADRGHVFGKTHPKTLKSRNNLAQAYQAAGRLDKAIPLYQSTLADREDVLGQTHPDTLKSRHNLACAYRASGRVEEASTLHQRTLADAEQVLGPDHPDTLAFRNDFAAD
jgi:tetratricopeptide (TPR) repeat protein